MNEGEMPAEEDADAPLSDEAAGTAGRGWGGGRGGVRGGGRGGSGGPGQGPGSYAGPARLGVAGEPEKTNVRTPGSVCLTLLPFPRIGRGILGFTRILDLFLRISLPILLTPPPI
jgi:hypothetical protein